MSVLFQRVCRSAIMVLSIGTISSSSFAWGDLDTRSKPVSVEKLLIKTNDGKEASADITYIITATYRVNEHGNASGVDNRTCSFDPEGRQMRRSIVVTPNGSQPITFGYKLIELPRPGLREFKGFPNDNCNKHVMDNHDLDDTFNQALGDRDTWKSNIDADLQEVRTALALIGAVQGN